MKMRKAKLTDFEQYAAIYNDESCNILYAYDDNMKDVKFESIADIRFFEEIEYGYLKDYDFSLDYETFEKKVNDRNLAIYVFETDEKNVFLGFIVIRIRKGQNPLFVEELSAIEKSIVEEMKRLLKTEFPHKEFETFANEPGFIKIP